MVSILMAFIVGGAEPEGNLTQVERDALAYRKNIKTGHLLLDFLPGDASQPGAWSLPSKAELWFDGDKLRNDVYRKMREGDPPVRLIVAKNCEIPDHVLRYCWTLEKRWLAFEIAKRKKGGAQAIDPRSLGISTVGVFNLSKWTLDDLVDSMQRKKASTSSILWHGRKCLVVSYQAGHISVNRWIVPDYGPSIVKVSTETKNEGHSYLYSAECEYAETPNKVWFPSRFSLRREVDGRKEEEEVVKISARSINQTLDDSIFKIRGMDIPAGTEVLGLLKGKGKRGAVRGTWNGKEVVPNPPASKAAAVIDLPATSGPPGSLSASQSWWSYTYAIIFAIVGGSLLWAARRRKPSPGSGERTGTPPA